VRTHARRIGTCAALLIAGCTTTAPPPDHLVLGLVHLDGGDWIAIGGDREEGNAANIWHGHEATPMAIAGGRRLYDACALPGGRVLVVGFGGAAEESADGGATWRSRQLGPGWLASVDVLGDEVWVVGGGPSPTVMVSDDGGRTFVERAGGLPADANNLRDVCMTGAGAAILVGADGLLASTRDGGRTYEVHETGTDTWLRSVAVDGDRVAIGGTHLVLHGRLDALTRIDLPEDKVNAMCWAGHSRLLMATMSGRLLELRDGSVRVLASDNRPLTAFAMAPGGGLWVLGDGCRLHVERDPATHPARTSSRAPRE